MSRQVALAMLGGAAALILLLALVFLDGCGTRSPAGEATAAAANERPGATDVGTGEAAEPFADPEPVETAAAILYFPGERSKLYPEARDVETSEDRRELAARLVRALIAGPTQESLSAILPAELTVTGVLISAQGVAYVDLRSDTLLSPPVTGSTQETLTLQSVVQTLVENLPEIESVVFLWNGRQRQTFGGHIDTTHPLVPDPDLLAS